MVEIKELEVAFQGCLSEKRWGKGMATIRIVTFYFNICLGPNEPGMPLNVPDLLLK